ncbi:MAG: Threonine dehydratase [Deltaproteobacteria bacterium]|nr:Threonine dehydratase [Deltaproteobacteria bacterium]
MTMISKTDIEAAYRNIRTDIVCTPLLDSQKLSRLCGCQVLLKLENFQMTGSFKDRGALNRLLSLSPEQKGKGIVAASAGNHAQAVAYHCQRLGIRSKIVMPVGTPLVKTVSTQGYGAEVILHGDMVDDAGDLAFQVSKEEGLTFIHPFADPLIIAGQGTIGIEIIQNELAKDLAAVLCPVGGGGLISGIATYLKETNPAVRVIGVEAYACPSMKASLLEGHPVKLEKASSLADGIAIKRVGQINFDIVRKYVDEVVTVEENEIANAVLLLLEMEKIVAEGAGAVPLAALLNRKVRLEGRKVLLIISGGNIDVNILGKIITRGLAMEGRIAQLTVRLKDLPGSLTAALEIMKGLRANILEIAHHRFDSLAPFGQVDVSITLETKGHAHIHEIQGVLKGAGYLCENQCRF